MQSPRALEVKAVADLIRLREWDPVVSQELPTLDFASKPAGQLRFDGLCKRLV